MSSKLAELLKLAKESGEVGLLNSVERFIQEKPVEPFPIPRLSVERVFYHYLLFCRDNNLIPFSKRKFSTEMVKAGYRTKSEMYERRYYIKQEPFHMTEEEELAMKRERRIWEKNLLMAKRVIEGRLRLLKKLKAEKQKAKKQAKLKARLKRKHAATLMKTEASKVDSSQK